MARPSAQARSQGLLTVPEAAARLHVAENTFRSRLDTGLYPPPTLTEGQNRYFSAGWLLKAARVERKIRGQV